MNEPIRGHLRHSTYEAIKWMIVTGQLAPGSRLTELDLTEQLQVSRTPVREALNKLQRDGLVIERPRTGFSVVTFDEVMLCEVFDLRAELDNYATRLTTGRITPDQIQTLQDMVAECENLAKSGRGTKANLQEMQVGIEIHRSVAAFSGNAVLAEMMNGLLDKCQVYVWMELTNLNDWKGARDDHALIVDAIARGDVEAACRESRRHIQESRDGILSLFKMRQDLRSLYTGRAEVSST